MSNCRRCGAAVSDAFACTHCGRQLEYALGDVPALSADLDTVLARLTVYRELNQRVKGKGDTPVMFDIRAGQIREHLHAILSTWCRLVHRERHAETRRPLPVDRPAAMAGWLLAEVEWLRHHEAAAQAIEEITEAVRAVRPILDAPATRVTHHVGACPENGCPGEVRAYVPRDEKEPIQVGCTNTNEHAWDSTQWLRLRKRMMRLEVA